MSAEPATPGPEAWARFRFAVVGPLLAAPPPLGELKPELARLAEKPWNHPITGEPVRFGFSTVERWYYQAKNTSPDPVGALVRKVRRDSGVFRRMPEPLRQYLCAQHREHPSWSCQLHYDNAEAAAKRDPRLGPLPSYGTVRRFLRASGLVKRRRLSARDTEGARRAQARLESREVRGYEAAYVHGLWHTDFHHASRPVLTPEGEWAIPVLLGVLDDRSRVACHLQWYWSETAENAVHGLSQALQKRGLPRALMSDQGTPFAAAEMEQGLSRLSIVHETTLPYSPYQNAKQESFWAQVEGRLMAMLERVPDLTLARLNDVTQVWAELEYHREIHSELGQSPLARYQAGPSVGRDCPDSETLRRAFTRQEWRTQRRSDGTLVIEGRRFEVPSRYRTLERVRVRYAVWDLSRVYLADPKTGKVLCRLFPQDKTRNAEGERRALAPVAPAAEEPGVPDALPPLLAKLLSDYAATGLPPAYLPKEDRP